MITHKASKVLELGRGPGPFVLRRILTSESRNVCLPVQLSVLTVLVLEYSGYLAKFPN